MRAQLKLAQKKGVNLCFMLCFQCLLVPCMFQLMFVHFLQHFYGVHNFLCASAFFSPGQDGT